MKKNLLLTATIGITIAILVAGCSGKQGQAAKPFASEVVHPEWSRDMVLYEVNVRQYTPEGTFDAFSEHLPRLKEMGINALWLMPIHPIGEVNRKEGLGSYYSVKDFKAVNPEFGTMEDFKELISKVHDMGMYLMMDWVPNHSAWDNPLTKEHPEFYARDKSGNFTPPIGTDWTDVIQFNWKNKGLHDYMIDAMKFWVELGVDGFRVDHPHNTPVKFWEKARDELMSIRPVLMLAEHEAPGGFMVKGFDMNYAWEMHHLLKNVAQGKDSTSAVHRFFEKELKVFPQNVFRLHFLSNHDENSWSGTVDSLFGESHRAMATLIFTVRGVPLLYSGQEVCLDKQLRFFERDTIEWDTCNMTSFYTDLIRLKKTTPALLNGEWGGSMKVVSTNRDSRIFAFYREKEQSRILVMLNLSGRVVSFTPRAEGVEGDYTEYFSGTRMSMPQNTITLEPWDAKVYVGD